VPYTRACSRGMVGLAIAFGAGLAMATSPATAFAESAEAPSEPASNSAHASPATGPAATDPAPEASRPGASTPKLRPGSTGHRLPPEARTQSETTASNADGTTVADGGERSLRPAPATIVTDRSSADASQRKSKPAKPNPTRAVKAKVSPVRSVTPEAGPARSVKSPLDGPAGASARVADTAERTAPDADSAMTAERHVARAPSANVAVLRSYAEATVTDALPGAVATPEPAPALTTATKLVSGMASFLSDMTKSATDPAQTPMASPTQWALLAFARRRPGDPTSTLVAAQQTQTAEPAAVHLVARAAATVAPPTASAPTLGTPNSATGAISGSLNVTDPSGQAIVYTVKTAPSQGNLTVNSTGAFVYTPTQSARLLAGESLTTVSDAFVVTASNGAASTDVAVAVPIFTGQLSSTATTNVVGNAPQSIITYGSRIYVANTGSNTISVIDANTNAALGVVGSVGRSPTQLALSPDGSVLYVVNRDTANVAAISTVSGALVGSISVGGSPQGVAVGSNGTRLYVSNSAGNTVTVLNTATGVTVATVKVGTAPTTMTVSPDGTRVYVANRTSGTVSAINVATNTVVATIAVGSSPAALASNSAGTRLYVTNSGSNSVSVVNTTTSTSIATIAVRSQPSGIAVSRDGSLVYVANGDSTLSVIDTKTNTKITGTLPIPAAAGSAITMSPDGMGVYVTNGGGNTVNYTSLTHSDQPLPPANPSGTVAAVSEDFSGAAGTPPDQGVWNYLIGAGGTDGQLEAYLASTENAALDGNGDLVITARQQTVDAGSYGTFDYTSAALTTQDKLEYTYGTISARIDVPTEQGVWPAFWMLGSDYQTAGWPEAGEIDTMELGGTTIHGPGGYALNVPRPANLSPGFHTYWTTWEPNKITVGVDDTTVVTYTPDSLAPGVPWTFNDRSMFAILNVAVGGTLGTPSGPTEFPVQMVVDSFSYTPLTVTT
jgi:YVTN family beta-propeller protein/VCBS repeat-containing protein